MATHLRTASIAAVSLGLAVLVWAGLTWPLPRYVDEALPMGYTGGGDQPVRFMEAGDHLQLMYYFWLLGDMIAGDTPWMHNVYEFHTGDESARYQPSTMYIPFSLVYAVFERWGGRAFGFNMAGLLSIWLTLLFTWLLVRRYVKHAWLSGAGALVSILLPYRWFELMAGSPSGFAMAFIPLLFLLLDKAVRDGDLKASVGAGITVFFCFTSDLHAFFFAVLSMPAWCLFAMISRPSFPRINGRELQRMIAALLPAMTMTAAVIFYSQSIEADLGETDMADGRDLHEIAPFTPKPTGFFGWNPEVVSDRIYVGYTWTLLLVAGGITTLLAARKRPVGSNDLDTAPAQALAQLLILGGFVMVAGILAVGPHGPWGGKLFQVARGLIPSYDMIRQAGKIYILLPPVMALMAALSLRSIAAGAGSSRRAAWIAAGFVLLGALEYARRFDPLICRVGAEQPAYQSVYQDAQQHDQRAHAMMIPLWPGDSHYASIYQYYASRYRIRMVNGYTPAINQRYYEEIFQRFQSINQGWMTDDQADALLSRGIHHLILHEDLFPEKVSPFPVAYTLQALLKHPRLLLLKQSGPVWAFRIIDEQRIPDVDDGSAWRSYFPGRHYLGELVPSSGGTVGEDSSASRGRYLRLEKPGGYASFGPVDAPPSKNPRWMVRVRGEGSLSAQSLMAGMEERTERVELAAGHWTWIDIPAAPEGYGGRELILRLLQGRVDLCSALFTAGPRLVPEPGDVIEMPAAMFFRAGHLDPATGYVHFLTDRDRAGHVFYGPKLPLPEGRYEITLRHHSNASADERVGSLLAEQLFLSTDHPSVPAISGSPAVLELVLTNNLPLNLIFDYHRRADSTLEAVVIRRMD